VLQTHSLGDNQRPDGARYCGANKSEVMRRCTRSLIESVNYAVDFLSYFDFELVVLDDHSDEYSLNHLKNNLNIAKFPTKLIHLESKGIMPSILACYEYGKKHGSDWVYFVQDDYLYEEKAIYEMLMVAIETSQKLQNFTSVFPYNDPYRYEPVNTVIQSHIIRSQGKHWRTQVMTSSCFLVHHHIILKNWDLFYNMGTHAVTSDMEDNTINQLFRTRGYYLFVPIPSLALHMQYEAEHDPFVNWRLMWDKYDTDSSISSKIDSTKKNLLHIGFGGTTIKNCMFNQDLVDLNEITMDIDSNYNPDIVCDILNMSEFPSNSVDVIYLSHALEHIDLMSVPNVLNEFRRILKDNGFARMIVPNLTHFLSYLTEDKLLDTVYESSAGPVTVLDVLYGHSYSIKRKNNDFMRHKMSYTVGTVKQLASMYNLNLTAEEKDSDLIITLTK
jgi:predicted SAM-dependent methyltransferase